MFENLRFEVRLGIGEEENVYGINAILDGSLVGHAYGKILEDNTGYLESLHVDECMRLKGVGCLLLGKFIECMRQKGVSVITGELKTPYGLHVPETKRFYEKNGFSVDGDFNLRRRL